MSEKNINELMHIQNELLGDIKNVESRVNDKIKIINQSFEEQKILNEQKLKSIEKTINTLLQKFETLPKNDPSKEKNYDSQIFMLNKKIDDNETNILIKIKDLETNLKESTYKYDRAIIDNFTIPGLIGTKAPFKTVRQLIETIYKKILDSAKVKEKQELDFKFYKEKLESIINNNKKELELLEIKMRAYYTTKSKELEKIFNDKFDVFEERFNSMRKEISKATYDVLEKYKEINIIYDKMNEILKKSADDYNDEFTQHRSIINEMNDKFKQFDDVMKNFDENYNKFIEDYNKFKDDLKIINENKVLFTNLENKVKELEKSIIIWKKKTATDIFEKNESKDISESNLLESLLKEDEKNSILSNYLKKLDLTKIKSEKEFLIAQLILKRNGYQISEGNEENKKVNNILYDSDFFRDSNGNSNYSIDVSGIKKAKMPLYRVKSGKIFSQYPYISHDNTYDNTFNKKSGRETERIDNLKMGRSILKKNFQKELNFPYNNHKYRYLEKKIDILGKTLVENINKIIVQVNLLKKNKINKGNNTDNIEKNNKEKEEIEEDKIHSIQNKNFFKNISHETKFDITKLKNASINFKYRKINSKINQKLKTQRKNDE